jgi:hypothetical protein
LDVISRIKNSTSTIEELLNECLAGTLRFDIKPYNKIVSCEPLTICARTFQGLRLTYRHIGCGNLNKVKPGIISSERNLIRTRSTRHTGY